MDKKKLENNIWKYYLYSCLKNMLFIIPIIAIFFLANNLTLAQIMLLEALFSIAIVTFEIPTGAFADSIGRRRCLYLGSLILSIACLIYVTGNTFIQFFIAEVTWAIGFSLTSGADQALLYDTLKNLGKEEAFKKIQGTSYSFYLIGGAISSIIGGLLAKISLELTFYVTSAAFLISLIITFSMIEPTKSQKFNIKRYWQETRESINFTIKHPQVRWLILYGSIIASFGLIGFWFFQPYLKLTGLDIKYFGFVFALFNLFAALVSRYAHAIEKKIGMLNSFYLIPLASAVGFLLMGNILIRISFLFIFLLQFARAFVQPLLSDYLNRHVESKRRATVLSIDAMSGRLLFAAVSPFFGWIADLYSIQIAFLMCGLTLLVCSFVLLLFFKVNQ